MVGRLVLRSSDLFQALFEGTFKVVVAVVTRLAQIQAKVVLVSGSSMDSCKSSCTVVPLTPTEDEHKKRGQSINYKRGLAYFRKPKVLNQIRDHSVQSPARTETSLKTTLLTVSETLSFLKRTLRHTETPTRSVMNESVVQCESKQPFFFFFFFHTQDVESHNNKQAVTDMADMMNRYPGAGSLSNS